MTPDLIGLIKEKQAQIVKLQQELDEARAVLSNGSGIQVSTNHPRPQLKKNRHQAKTGKLASLTGGPAKQQSSTGLAFRVLKENHHPLHLDEIVEKISKLGFTVNKGTLVGNLARRVLTKNIFYREKPNVYGLVEWQKQEIRL
ncbi:MAG TPA: HTH domain-containing protein [Nitrospiraceae bacterium]|jgi:hypothetical protein|nr:HTH domain-containing protein [Nitrospiraceae bacterium]